MRKLREGDRLLNEGKDIAEVVRHLDIAERTWNRWRSQYGGMMADEAKHLRQLETENARLKGYEFAVVGDHDADGAPSRTRSARSARARRATASPGQARTFVTLGVGAQRAVGESFVPSLRRP